MAGKNKKGRKTAVWFVCGLFALVAHLSLILTAVTGILIQADERALWNLFPVKSDPQVREACYSVVLLAETEAEDERAEQFKNGLAGLYITAWTVQDADAGTVHDQTLRQYTLALYRAALLERQGDLSWLDYQLYKLPYKMGNTELMQAALPGVQEAVGLPEGFLSREDVSRMEEEQEAENEAFLQYKKEHIYGRYYQFGNFDSYVDIGSREDGDGEEIRFVLDSGAEKLELVQTFRYQQDRSDYVTDPGPEGRTEFSFTGEDEVTVTKGGIESTAVYFRLQPEEFVIPDSSVRRLTEEEIGRMDARTRWLAKNEIYARHSYPFENEELSAYFAGRRWYHRGEYPAQEFRMESLSEIERENVAALEE